jgi:hypothetical protein
LKLREYPTRVQVAKDWFGLRGEGDCFAYFALTNTFKVAYDDQGPIVFDNLILWEPPCSK